MVGTTVNREYSLDIDFLGTHAEDLLDLDAPFLEEEVWYVVSRHRMARRLTWVGLRLSSPELLGDGQG
jgi:hypothetical protein